MEYSDSRPSIEEVINHIKENRLTEAKKGISTFRCLSGASSEVLWWVVLKSKVLKIEMVKLCVQKKCDINFVGPEGLSVLHCAALHNAEIIPNLLLLGAAPDAVDAAGMTVAMALTRSQEPEPVIARSMAALVVRGAALDAEDATGATVLHYAARRGLTELCCALAAAGLDPRAATASGESALGLFDGYRGTEPLVARLAACADRHESAQAALASVAASTPFMNLAAEDLFLFDAHRASNSAELPPMFDQRRLAHEEPAHNLSRTGSFRRVAAEPTPNAKRACCAACPPPREFLSGLMSSNSYDSFGPFCAAEWPWIVMPTILWLLAIVFVFVGVFDMK